MTTAKKYKRGLLRDKLRHQYDLLMAGEGARRSQVLQTIMDTPITVSDVYTEESLVQLLFNRKYSNSGKELQEK